jgi:hypothetical protein
MGVTVEGQVGPRTVQDGANTELRQTRMGGLVVADGHGRYWEPASRGYSFCVTTALAGTTIVAANNAPPAAAAATILSLYNPLNTQVNASILRVGIGSISGTPGAGSFAYCVSYNNVITAAQNATPLNTLSGQQTSKCKGFTQTGLTGGLVHTTLRAAPYTMFAGAIAATTPGLYMVEELAGSVVLPPGGVFTIASPATGTTHIVYAYIDYEEVPV